MNECIEEYIEALQELKIRIEKSQALASHSLEKMKTLLKDEGILLEAKRLSVNND